MDHPERCDREGRPGLSKLVGAGCSPVGVVQPWTRSRAMLLFPASATGPSVFSRSGAGASFLGVPVENAHLPGKPCPLMRL